MSIFDYYAAYYDLLYKDKDYAGEVDYLHNLIQNYSSAAKTILDFGCGTGKHDYLLAQKGYQVVGVDLSDKMIKRAIQNEATIKANVNFCQGDFRTIRLNQSFDVITSLFHVINYQVTNEDLMACFKTAKVHLEPSGLFIFDSWYGPGVLTDKPVRRIKEMEDDRISVERLAEPLLHINKNVVDVNYTLKIKDKINLHCEQLKEQHRMRYLFFPEIEMLAHLNNFEIAGFEKWLHGGTPDLDWFVTVVCRLKN